MEADSTTYDNTKSPNEDNFPFSVCPGNLKLYRDLTENNSDKNLEQQLVERLIAFGLLPDTVPCLTQSPNCKMVRKAARVVDKVQWYCETCNKRQPIRTGSFFLRMQCSLLQTLQIILAWCEDAEYALVAEHFNIKSRVVTLIYDRLDELAINELGKTKLGGGESVVLAEIYPDCLNRLSPDTTDQPHVHRILMLTDTKHIPPHYQMHVIQDDFKKNPLGISSDESLKTEIEEAISAMVAPDSTLVVGSSVPNIDSACSMQHLSQYCDADMQHFLSTRIWRQAVSVCAASRSLCGGGACAGAVRVYVRAALYRLRRAAGYYHHVLTLIATHYTSNAGGATLPMEH